MWDNAQVLATNSEKFDCLLVAAMSFSGAIEPQAREGSVESFCSNVVTAVHMPRNSKSGQCCDRSATNQQPHCFWRKTYDLPEPVNDLSFYINRSVIPSGTTRVHRGRQRVAKDPQTCRRRIHPAPKTGMSVSEWVRLDLASESCQYIVHLLS